MIRALSIPKATSRRSAGLMMLLLVGLILASLVGGGAAVRVGVNRGSRPLPDVNQLTAAQNAALVYLMNGDRVTVLNAQTGQVVRQLPLRLATQSLFLAAHPATRRLFVTDALLQGDRAVDTLTVYRTTDWSIERQVPVPDIIRYMNGSSGILPSNDGKILYVYNYNDRTRGAAPVRYWLTALNLDTGTWLGSQVDLPNCGASQLIADGPTRVAVLCADSNDIRIVDAGTLTNVEARSIPLTRQRIGNRLPRVAAIVLRGNDLYVVSENREVHVLSASGAEHVLSASRTTDRMVPFQPMGVDGGNNLLIPSGSPEELSRGLLSEIAVVNASSGMTVKTLQPSRPFRWAAFSADGSTAFLSVVGADKLATTGLVQMDLQTGNETQVLQGPVGSGFISSSGTSE